MDNIQRQKRFMINRINKNNDCDFEFRFCYKDNTRKRYLFKIPGVTHTFPHELERLLFVSGLNVIQKNSETPSFRDLKYSYVGLKTLKDVQKFVDILNYTFTDWDWSIDENFVGKLLK